MECGNGKTVYIIEGTANGKKYEIEVTPEGKVLEVEQKTGDNKKDDEEDEG